MSGDFIDTNVFIYLVDETAPIKRQRAQELILDALAFHTGNISFQVVQEALHVLTQRLAVPVRPEDAVAFFDHFLVPLWRVMPSQPLYRRSIEIKSRYGYRFYDSLIIAAALECSCSRLYSEDMQHGQRIDGLIIENPFKN